MIDNLTATYLRQGDRSVPWLAEHLWCLVEQHQQPGDEATPITCSPMRVEVSCDGEGSWSTRIDLRLGLSSSVDRLITTEGVIIRFIGEQCDQTTPPHDYTVRISLIVFAGRASYCPVLECGT